MMLPGLVLDDDEVGPNGTLFDPQGGLRASLEELCPVVVNEVATRPAWVFEPAIQYGDTDDGYFNVYGEGPQIHPAADSPVPGVKLIRHHGEAYGLYSGARHAPVLDVEIAQAVTGMPALEDTEIPASSIHRMINAWDAPAGKATGDLLRR